MRGGVVAAGIALIIVGVILFMMSNTSVGAYSGPGGGAAGYTSGQPIFLMIGVVLGIVGFILLIAGLAASKKEKPAPPPTIVVQPPTTLREPEVLLLCPECRSRVSSSSKFCPECGEDMMPRQKENFIKVKPVEQEEKLEPAKKAKPLKKAGFCIYCGSELHEGSGFCHKCGKEVKKAR